MTRNEVTITVNGEEYTREVEDRKLLVHFLRDDLDLTGTHQGCVVGKCGACTILHDGVPKKSCMMYATQMEGEELMTVEGLSEKAEREGTAMKTEEGTTLHPLQMGFKQMHGLQCGFCTPGMLMTALALIEENPEVSRDEVKTAISGNICRCTGYNSIIDSIQWAGQALQEDVSDPNEVDLHGEAATDGGCACCHSDESQ